MSDLFLTLAQTSHNGSETGLSCFLATGWLPDGSRNRLKLQRLKDKCGNKSNASSARSNSTTSRPPCSATKAAASAPSSRWPTSPASISPSAAAGLMRQALSQAIHHTTHRRAFQRSLVDLPIMQQRRRRPGPRIRSHDVDVHAPRPRARPLRHPTPPRLSSVPHLHPGGEVLGLQARPGLRRRGPRMSRRQRLHLRPPHGAPVSRGPAQRHLGRHRQRHLPGRPPRHATRPRNHRSLPSRNPPSQRREPHPGRLHRPPNHPPPRPGHARTHRPPHRRTNGIRPPSQPPPPPRPLRRRRRVLHHPPQWRLGPCIRNPPK